MKSWQGIVWIRKTEFKEKNEFTEPNDLIQLHRFPSFFFFFPRRRGIFGVRSLKKA